MPEVIPEKGTEVAGTVLVQVGATPAPLEVKNWPLVPAALFGIKAWENLRLPMISSFSEGPVVPMPTLPVPEKVRLYPPRGISVAAVSVPPNLTALTVLVSPLLKVRGYS